MQKELKNSDSQQIMCWWSQPRTQKLLRTLDTHENLNRWFEAHIEDSKTNNNRIELCLFELSDEHLQIGINDDFLPVNLINMLKWQA